MLFFYTPFLVDYVAAAADVVTVVVAEAIDVMLLPLALPFCDHLWHRHFMTNSGIISGCNLDCNYHGCCWQSHPSLWLQVAILWLGTSAIVVAAGPTIIATSSCWFCYYVYVYIWQYYFASGIVKHFSFLKLLFLCVCTNYLLFTNATAIAGAGANSATAVGGPASATVVGGSATVPSGGNAKATVMQTSNVLLLWFSFMIPIKGHFKIYIM